MLTASGEDIERGESLSMPNYDQPGREVDGGVGVNPAG